MLALAATNAYVVFFNFSWGPVMWVMPGEMFPGITMSFPIKAVGLGLTVTYGLYAISALILIYSSRHSAGPPRPGPTGSPHVRYA